VGEECLAVLAVAFVVMAVIGLLVSVFAGMVYANRSIQRHLHIVSKKTMTKDLVVKDLAPGAIPIEVSCDDASSTGPQQPETGDIETGFLMTNTYNSNSTTIMRRDV
jgi:hypothetical protein